ncbi:SIR2 family protein [Paraburkholderia phytofirmans]|uniref:SIR2 family protein n=1 Tax=Paraburkholderia phytofirmans TaxID=261302 RepID=UPI0038BB2BDC
MQICTAVTLGEWRDVEPDPIDPGTPFADTQEDGKNEVRRVLSDCFRSNNFVVLTGLGTSLYVNVDKEESQAGQRIPLTGRKIAPTMWALWEQAKARAGANFPKVLELVRYPTDERSAGNIEALLSQCKLALEFLGEGADKALIATFVSDTEAIIRDEVDFLGSSDVVPLHTELLRRIVRRTSRKVRPKIFTTNYDLCFEHAARQGRYVVVDGFSHSSPQTFDSMYFGYDIVTRLADSEAYEYISNVLHLYKLHGSLDWEKDPETGEIVRRAAAGSPLLIYPRNTKYEHAFEQPYIEMMTAFQAALRQPNTGLLVVGFGFNDNHLSEPILSAVRANLSLKMVVCDPSLVVKSMENRFVRDFKSLIDQGDARLSLVAGTFEDVVPHIPDIAAQTDFEAHLERVRLLRGHDNA